MLDANIKTQLTAYLEKIRQPIELVASLDGSEKASEMWALLQDIAALSDKVSVTRADDDARIGGVELLHEGPQERARFGDMAPLRHQPGGHRLERPAAGRAEQGMCASRDGGGRRRVHGVEVGRVGRGRSRHLRGHASRSAITPASIAQVPITLRGVMTSFNNHTPSSAANRTEVSRSAATMATGACVMAHRAMP